MSIENVNAAKETYTKLTNEAGNVQGYKNVVASYEDGILTFTEDDGDIHQLTDIAQLSEEDLAQLNKDLNPEVGDKVEINNTDDAAAADKAEDTAEAAKADAADATTATDLEASQAKLDELQGQWDTLNAQAEQLKSNIEKISDDIKKDIDELLKKQDKVTEEEKTRIKEVLDEKIEAFKEKAKNGGDVSLEDLKGEIKTALSDGTFSSEMAEIMSQFAVTNTKMKSMESLLGQLSGVNTQMSGLDSDISSLKDEVEKAKEAEEAAKEAETTEKKCCDPIGYQDEDGTKYEFVVDRDNDNKLDDFSEFLGADDNFDEMKALDTDGKDGVTKDELQAAGVKVLVTDKDGNQTMKTLDEAFGDKEINIDTDNFKEAAQGMKADNGQTLLGNFGIKIGDEEHVGYSTLDSADYLKENYTFESETPDVKADGTKAGKTAEDVVPDLKDDNAEARSKEAEINDQFVKDYTELLKGEHGYEAQMTEVAKILDLDDEIVEKVKTYAEETGTYVGKQTVKKIEKAVEEQKKVDNADEDKDENADDKDVNTDNKDNTADVNNLVTPQADVDVDVDVDVDTDPLKDKDEEII